MIKHYIATSPVWSYVWVATYFSELFVKLSMVNYFRGNADSAIVVPIDIDYCFAKIR